MLCGGKAGDGRSGDVDWSYLTCEGEKEQGLRDLPGGRVEEVECLDEKKPHRSLYYSLRGRNWKEVCGIEGGDQYFFSSGDVF